MKARHLWQSNTTATSHRGDRTTSPRSGQQSGASSEEYSRVRSADTAVTLAAPQSPADSQAVNTHHTTTQWSVTGAIGYKWSKCQVSHQSGSGVGILCDIYHLGFTSLVLAQKSLGVPCWCVAKIPDTASEHDRITMGLIGNCTAPWPAEFSHWKTFILTIFGGGSSLKGPIRAFTLFLFRH